MPPSRAAQSGGQSGGQSAQPARSAGSGARAAPGPRTAPDATGTRPRRQRGPRRRDRGAVAGARPEPVRRPTARDQGPTRAGPGPRPGRRARLRPRRRSRRTRAATRTARRTTRATATRATRTARQNDQGNRDRDERQQGGQQGGQDDRPQDGQGTGQGNRDGNRDQGDRDQGNQGNQGDDQNRSTEEGGNRRRRRRGRDRERTGGQGGQGGGQGQGGQGGQNAPYRERRTPSDADLEVTEDDVLVPVGGIVDILDNYAFVRTSGYLPGTNDVYVSLSMVRRYHLRKGDAVTGAVRQAREGERKEKFNPLVRLDTINGGDVDAAKDRVDFNDLTPLYPSERLRLETGPANMIGRVIDIAAPIGKGQRGLIVSPPKAGKTMVLQAIANAITLQQPRVPPHDRARRRAARGGHRLPAHRQGRGHRLDLRPAREPTTRSSPSWPSSGPSGWSSSATTSWCCSTASPGWGVPTTWPRRPAAGSSPAASTPARSTRRRSSSAPPATSRTAGR